MASTVVVQELRWKVPSAHSHSSAASNIAIHQEGAILPQRPELGQDVLAAGNHFVGVIGCDVGGEELGASGLLDAGAHGLHHLWNALVHLAEHLVSLRLVVLDEITWMRPSTKGTAGRHSAPIARAVVTTCSLQTKTYLLETLKEQKHTSDSVKQALQHAFCIMGKIS